MLRSSGEHRSARIVFSTPVWLDRPRCVYLFSWTPLWGSNGGSLQKMESNKTQWYALQIQARLGNTASACLRGKGYEEFLPVYRSRRRWSDRIKTIDVPLFPGYLFCRFDPQDRIVPILTTPGIIGIVAAGRVPIPVDEAEIEAVRQVVRSGLAVQKWPHLRVGSRIYIERGPLTGIEGVVVNDDKVYRLIVSVSLLQRSVAVEIDRDWARPAAEGTLIHRVA